MKKNLLILITLLFTTTLSFAHDFDLEAPVLEHEFASLDQIESYIAQNETASYADIKNVNPSLLAGIKLSESTSANSFKGDDLPLNIPPFVWGCCFGVLGVAFVYFTTDKDEDMSKKALFGCLVNGAVVGAGCLVSSLGGNGYYGYYY